MYHTRFDTFAQESRFIFLGYVVFPLHKTKYNNFKIYNLT